MSTKEHISRNKKFENASKKRPLSSTRSKKHYNISTSRSVSQTRNLEKSTGFENNPFLMLFDLLSKEKYNDFLLKFASIDNFIEENKEISNELLNKLTKEIKKFNLNSEQNKEFVFQLYNFRKIINQKTKETIIFPERIEDLKMNSLPNYLTKGEYYRYLFLNKLNEMINVFSENQNKISNDNLKNQAVLKELFCFSTKIGILFECNDTLHIPSQSLILFKQKNSELIFYGIVLETDKTLLKIELCKNQKFEMSPKLFFEKNYFFVVSKIKYDFHFHSCLYFSLPPEKENFNRIENRIITQNISKANFGNLPSLVNQPEGLWIISGQPGCGKTTYAQQLVAATSFYLNNTNPTLILSYSTNSLKSFFSKFRNLKYKIYDANILLDESLNVASYIDKTKKILNSINIIETQEYLISLSTFSHFEVFEESHLKYFTEDGRKIDALFYDWLLCNWDRKKWRCNYDHKSWKISEDCLLGCIESKSNLLNQKEKFEGKEDSKSINALGRINHKFGILGWALKRIKSTESISSLLEKNLWDLAPIEKWQLYHYWLDNLQISLWLKLIPMINTIKEDKEKHRNNKILMIASDMSQQKVIGLNFYSAILLQESLRRTHFSTVFIDDSDLLDEADLISFQGQWDKLFLFGTETLVQNNSLFSRIALIKKLPNLDLQRRMRPKFCDIFKGLFVRPMKSSQSLSQVTMICGCEGPFSIYLYPNEVKNLNFDFEVEFLIHFAFYLIRQSNKAQTITILTGNSNETLKLREFAQKQKLDPQVTILSANDYHGLENDIILLALGDLHNFSYRFLLSALTRARHGLYILGDRDSALFGPHISIFLELQSKSSSIDEGFHLKCRFHGDSWYARNPKDFLSGHGTCLLPLK